MTQWLVTCLPHLLILVILPFEIFFYRSQPQPNLQYENSIMKTPAREPLRISHPLAEFVICQVNNTYSILMY